MAIDESFSIERRQGKSPDVSIIRLSGPITLRTLFALQTDLRGTPPTPVTILDLSGVPYMDSAGMGTVINHYVHCQNKGCKLIAAGVSSRVLELFKLTRVSTVIAMAASVEEAEASA